MMTAAAVEVPLVGNYREMRADMELRWSGLAPSRRKSAPQSSEVDSGSGKPGKCGVSSCPQRAIAAIAGKCWESVAYQIIPGSSVPKVAGDTTLKGLQIAVRQADPSHGSVAALLR